MLYLLAKKQCRAVIPQIKRKTNHLILRSIPKKIFTHLTLLYTPKKDPICMGVPSNHRYTKHVNKTLPFEFTLRYDFPPLVTRTPSTKTTNFPPLEP
jgi:hypothetical protein